MTRPFCHYCMRQLTYAKGGRLVFAQRTVNGTALKLHISCAERFDSQQADENLAAAEWLKGQNSE